MSIGINLRPRRTLIPKRRDTELLLSILFTKSGSLHGYTSLWKVIHMMIHSPDLYIDSLSYTGDLKVILHQIARFRLRGRRAQMSWKHLMQSIGKSRRTLAKLLKSEKFREVVKKIRRGKKQTNLYYLADWLWNRLTVGRKVPRVKSPQGEVQRPEPGRACNLLALFAAELAKAV